MFTIDMMSRVPVYEQIIEQLQSFVLTGVLNTGDQIPSVRSLSVTLSINPNTIQKAYTELDRRGIIYSVPGKGCFISEDAINILKSLGKERLKELKNILNDLLVAGITKDEILSCVNDVYN